MIRELLCCCLQLFDARHLSCGVGERFGHGVHGLGDVREGHRARENAPEGHCRHLRRLQRGIGSRRSARDICRSNLRLERGFLAHQRNAGGHRAGVVALTAYGIMAILSNLSAGVIAERWGQRAMPVVYGAITVALALLPLTTRGHFVLGLTNCLVFGYLYALHNTQVQMTFMDVAEKAFPQVLNFASLLNPTSFNIGIAVGSLVGGAALSQVESYAWLGPVGAVFTLAACLCACWLVSVERRIGGAVAGCKWCVGLRQARPRWESSMWGCFSDTMIPGSWG